MKKLSILSIIWCIVVLWYCFGATTTINTVSSSYTTNIIRKIFGEPLVVISNRAVIGASGLSSGRLGLYGEGANGALVLGTGNPASDSVFRTFYSNYCGYLLIGDAIGGIGLGNSSIYFGRNDLSGTNFIGASYNAGGQFRIGKLMITNLVLLDGTILAMPSAVGVTNAALAIGTNQLYWRPIP